MMEWLLFLPALISLIVFYNCIKDSCCNNQPTPQNIELNRVVVNQVDVGGGDHSNPGFDSSGGYDGGGFSSSGGDGGCSGGGDGGGSC